jgi:2,4-dienoyl-CoA reductase-like NADH-dependent reductase (Old Yellow Enzyme family)
VATTIDSPLALPCGVTVKNRLMKSAMSEALGTIDNHVTPGLATLYGRWAKGGIGISVTGNVMVDRRALGEPGNVCLEDDRDQALLRAWAAAGTQNGCLLFMQLNHPGRQAPRGLNKETVSASAVSFGPEMANYFVTPRALTEAEIEDIISRFANAARLAKEAGFSGVQIHGAHGYLVSQFLSPNTNKREDQWGGPIENRMRFAVEVYKRIRAAVGPGFPVSIKLNSADFQRGGFTEEESLRVVQTLSDLGMDLIEISGGTYEAPAMSMGNKKEVVKESTQKREAYFLEFAEKVRSRVKGPLAVTGGFRTRSAIDEALRGGAIDMAGIARSVALDPDFPNKLLANENVTSLVKPIKVGIAAVDKAALMEVLFYGRQIQRMSRGLDPLPNESPLMVLTRSILSQGLGIFRTRLRS